MSGQPYELRSGRPEDCDFLWTLKLRTMRDYIEQTWGGWDETAQAGFFQRAFQPDKLQIILVAGHDSGVLSVSRPLGEIFLATIEIVPERQRQGIGSAVIRDLQAEANSRGLPLRLQVLKANAAARRLYQRLGFQAAGETETHHLMLSPPVTRRVQEWRT
jgi:ribosomal protein S18 acetylase RimI-like enzyme